MEEKKYNLSSPEVLKFLNLSEKDVNPKYRNEQVTKLLDRFSIDDGAAYENALINQGANPQSFEFLNNYIEFKPDWKNQASVKNINELANLAQTNPNKIYSYNLKEGPLYRGSKLDKSPNVGEEITFSRFKSFSPDVNIAGPFVNEGIPLDFSLSDEEFKKRLKLEENQQKTLFQVQADSPGNFNYLITPGTGESEVLARSGSRYLVEAKERFPFHQRGMTGDIDFIKLRQLYGTDPIGSAIQGGVNLAKENMPGAIISAGLSALNPTVAEQIKNNKYSQAAETVAKDVILGALTEAGIKKVAPFAGKYAPAIMNTASRIIAPVTTGGALFMQGQPGSLTDVVTKKAAENPISWLPSVKPNPKTDLGARASRAISNEATYAFQQLLQGRIPYIGK
jgi:hypothetical protein